MSLCWCDPPEFESSHTTNASLWLSVSLVSSMTPCLLMSWIVGFGALSSSSQAEVLNPAHFAAIGG